MKPVAVHEIVSCVISYNGCPFVVETTFKLYHELDDLSSLQFKPDSQSVGAIQ
jgi:hypothetical protein